jgi:NADPH:quinone reductase-like Zn-dependent oxidoreductase
VPIKNVVKIETNLPWGVLAELSDMLPTVWGSLFSSLGLQQRQRLLMRGGTTSVGMAAFALARRAGANVFATTRRESRITALKQLGAHRVIIDDGAIASSGLRFDKVLELLGTNDTGRFAALRGSRWPGLHGRHCRGLMEPSRARFR